MGPKKTNHDFRLTYDFMIFSTSLKYLAERCHTLHILHVCHILQTQLYIIFRSDFLLVKIFYKNASYCFSISFIVIDCVITTRLWLKLGITF